ncbi:MAG TPA: aldo/keto reductase [Solirubrobacteraceae bacterium]|nr:aldo/keto reductase [Solirubrobacteraceae bacterium]
MALLGSTDLDVFPLCLGGNVFGRSADERASFAVLDAYVEAGGNFIDTADMYVGGESEAIIGRWLAQGGRREQVVIATKVGMAPTTTGLTAPMIDAAIDGSLERLQTDYVDLYYAHQDDPGTPLAETLGAFDALVRAGKVRHVAASNYSAARLAHALEVSRREGFAAYAALQPLYNLVERDEYEGELAELCAREGIPCLPYFALAQGFLTGKYRRGGERVDSYRAARAESYLAGRGIAVLRALDEIAAAHDATLAAVSLAWLLAKPTVAAPIASARSVEQLNELLGVTRLRLTDVQVRSLDEAGRTTPG